MKRFLILFFFGCIATSVVAQKKQSSSKDSLQNVSMDEVVIISEKKLTEKMEKPLGSLDNYLEKSSLINMVRRGSYAWEPFINGMASERSVITIDGMRIYAACTDKMDPVTSYVEITNLAKANIHSGSSGSMGGATIAGSLDLVRKKSHFGDKQWKAMSFTGFETNNQQWIAGAGISRIHPKFYVDIDATARNAQNYHAGGGKEINYSQFTKYNLSTIAGYKIGEHQQVEASVIYDHALNVGYPALPMDVATARAFIGSVEYMRHHITPSILLWKTKVYYNKVTHVMDDTKRPIVPIRMDMPGWSNTTGFYSILQGMISNHTWDVTLSGHHNKSLAEMTMFANDPTQKDMFMLTWPGVTTNYGDVAAKDVIAINDDWKTTWSAGIGVHNNQVVEQLGLESLQIFYPTLKKSTTRFLKRASASAEYHNDHFQYLLGIGYGERAPSVSEGYGFYLFNSFDRFDYIGNPLMKNEKSIHANTTITYANRAFTAKFTGTYFYIKDYILGKPHANLSAMTIGANGIKIYEQLPYAKIVNTALELNYFITKNWTWTNKGSYRRGVAMQKENLPLMQPITYASGITFSQGSYSADVNVSGAARHVFYSPSYGESPLAPYAIVNLSAAKRFSIQKHSLLLKAGVENLLDTYYTTFSDWNRVPRIGRNFFVNLMWNY